MELIEYLLLCVLIVVVFYVWQKCERTGGIRVLFGRKSKSVEIDGIASIVLQNIDWCLFLFIVCLVMLISMKASSIIQAYYDGKNLVDATFVYAFIFQCLVLTGIFAFKKMASIKFEFGFSFNMDIAKKTAKCFAFSLMVVMGLGFILNVLTYLFSGRLPEKQDIINLFLRAENPFIVMSAIFSFLVLAPIAEELLFRGILYRALKGFLSQMSKSDFAKYVAAAISSLLFSIAHNNAFAFVPLFAFALLLTSLYERTQSIVSTMLCHSAFNFFNVVLIALFL